MLSIFKKNKFHEKFGRTFIKTITWRAWMMVTNSLIGWIVSGNPWVGVSFAVGAAVVNSISYIIHERIWNQANWGKEIDKDAVSDSAPQSA